MTAQTFLGRREAALTDIAAAPAASCRRDSGDREGGSGDGGGSDGNSGSGGSIGSGGSSSSGSGHHLLICVFIMDHDGAASDG